MVDQSLHRAAAVLHTQETALHSVLKDQWSSQSGRRGAPTWQFKPPIGSQKSWRSDFAREAQAVRLHVPASRAKKLALRERHRGWLVLVLIVSLDLHHGPSMKSLALALFLGSTVVRSAINSDGSEAVQPARANDPNDPSPIDGHDRYWPEQHNCPLLCEDYSNIHSWITYLSVDRLKRCDLPMLLQFSINHPLDDPSSTILIRGCTLDAQPVQLANSIATMAVENPKTAPNILSRLHTAPACSSDGTRVDGHLKVTSSGGNAADGNHVARLLEGMKNYFDSGDNCDESFLFAYYQDVVASVYIGSKLGRQTVKSGLDAFADRFRADGSAAKRTVAQLCGQRDPDRVLGVAVDTTGDLPMVQRLAWDWSHGKCANDLLPESNLDKAAVWEIGPTSNSSDFGNNYTSSRSRTHYWNGTLPMLSGVNETFSALNESSGRQGAQNGTRSVFSSGNDIFTAINSPTGGGHHRNVSFPTPRGSNSILGSGILNSISSFLRVTGSGSRSVQTTMPENKTLAASTYSASLYHNGTNTSVLPVNSTLDGKTPVTLALTTAWRSSTDSGRGRLPIGTSLDVATTPTSSSYTRNSNTVISSESKTSIVSSSDPQATEVKMVNKGTLRCKGSFSTLQQDRDDSIDIDNGTVSCYGALVRNGSINCNGTMSLPHSSYAETLGDQGSLTCNGTLDWNGRIVSGPTSCNGTLSRPKGSAVMETYAIFGCNGTLSSNSTLKAVFSSGSPAVSEARSHLAVRQASGTCATHLIQNGDTCSALAEKYGVTVSDIEKWNKGKTWAWTECKSMLVGYNLCVSAGSAPMPPPQQGTQCGPLVPDTKPPKDGESLADLNPCPLKACCSNWGFCGVFPSHCAVHAPEGGGPGTKKPGFQNTCVSNCETEIQQNSGPPAAFGRVGYYSSFAYERDCLYLEAKDANTDGSYTIIHWAFAEIDPATWKVVIKDKGNQWADFKALTNVKRIVSFGGWAYSTEPSTYNIIRQAILTNWDVFTDSVVHFIEDEGLDGVDFDWEYPGAPDILVGGTPIGEKLDGWNYLLFLRILRAKLNRDKTIAIAAPASFWYLKGFPIDEIAKTIDYVVYMTYDLHGQWDYGNVNAFDQCGSGKCIRSHVNLTETRNALAMITKAGVPNNKIFVGEASYGRTFHMAQDGCWGPLCEFTGSRTHSDATPGRCTNTGGYLANAEIQELLLQSGGDMFHDYDTNTDVMLYNGDYVSYMTSTTKDTRRSDWKSLNFGGSIDWALDLQSFTAADSGNLDIPSTDGEGCISGQGYSDDTYELCPFTCQYGFCPETVCSCKEMGELATLPEEGGSVDDIEAIVEFNVDLTRLCRFACKYGFCPEDVCVKHTEEGTDFNNYEADSKWGNNNHGCAVFKGTSLRDVSVGQCMKVCKPEIDEAKAAGRMYNYGCMVNRWNGTEPAWEKSGTSYEVAGGECICDNWVFNEIANSFLEALPAIAEISCYILMSSLKTVLSFGVDAVTGPAGRIIDAGSNALGAAAELASYTYNDDEDPRGAFDYWLAPCGGDSDLVPEDLKKGFDIANSIADAGTTFTTPKNIGRGSGRKGDEGNPRSKPSQSKPPQKPSTGNGNNGGINKKNKCHVPVEQSTRFVPRKSNTVRLKSCDKDVTKTHDFAITSLAYAPNAAATRITATCSEHWTQPCHHYSSAIAQNPDWKTMTCPHEAAVPTYRHDGKATDSWTAQHTGGAKKKGSSNNNHDPKADWTDPGDREQRGCDRDEYPPAYFLTETDKAIVEGGVDPGPNNRYEGQSVRYLHAGENRGAGSMWRSVCFGIILQNWSIDEVLRKVQRSKSKKTKVPLKDLVLTEAIVDHNERPEFTIGQWDHKVLPNDGLDANTCRPKKMTLDPGFSLLNFDKFYGGMKPRWDYTKPYKQGTNGD